MVKHQRKILKRFEVWLVNFEPSIGAEIKKLRPALVISPDEMNKILATVIVAPLTSTIKEYPSRIQTDFDNKIGEIMLDQLKSIDKSRLLKRIGTIDEQEAVAVCQVLETMFSYS
jgi:mRNA interferase MazF